MKTYQIIKTMSYEYFVEAESFEDAQRKIIDKQLHHESEDLIEWQCLDEHDGIDWTNEPVEMPHD
jgi:hypothetical protein